jgi:hypothetical protein
VSNPTLVLPINDDFVLILIQKETHVLSDTAKGSKKLSTLK